MGSRGPLPRAATGNKTGNAASAGPLPPPPAWLGEIAADEYRRVAAEVASLTAADFGPVVTYCAAFGEVAEHTRRLDGDTSAGIAAEGYTKTGDRGCVLNPRVRALDRARLALIAAAQALGLTPASRARSGEAPAAPQSPTGPAAFAAAHGDDAA